MSDFLTRLVTAAYVPAASMQPRPVAQYEPVEAPLPLWPQAVESQAPSTAQTAGKSGAPAKILPAPTDTAREQESSAPAARSGQTTAPQRNALERPNDSLDARAERDKQKEMAARRAGLVLGLESADDPRRAGSVGSPPPRTQMRRAASVPDTQAAAGSPLAIKHVLEPARSPAMPLRAAVQSESPLTRLAPPVTPGPAGQHATAVAPAAPASLTARRAAMASGAVSSSAEHTTQDERQIRMQPLTQPTLRSARQTSGAPGESRAAPAAVNAPTVRVTIGRIVIKAENANPTQPAKARPASSAKPALSLDDYLKTRRGGDV